MARQRGLEPLTDRLEGDCSVQLSYWRIKVAPYKAGGGACLQSVASSELADNVAVEESTSRVGRDKTLIDGLINIAIGVLTIVGEGQSKGTTGCVVGSLADKAAANSGAHVDSLYDERSF